MHKHNAGASVDVEEEIDHELSDAIEESLAQAERGEVLDADDVLTQMRARREARRRQ